jgi:hypothetical protein
VRSIDVLSSIVKDCLRLFCCNARCSIVLYFRALHIKATLLFLASHHKKRSIMQTIPEQISSAGRAQLQAQLELFSTIAMATVENTGRLALFQLEASRAALDRSWAAWSQWMTSGPRSMLDLMSRAQPAPEGGPAAARAGQDAPPPAPQPHAHTEGAGHAQVAPQVADPHPSQPPLARTPIAEAAAEVVPEGQAAVPLSAALRGTGEPVALPKVKPLQSVPPPGRSEGSHERKGVPRK